MEFFRKHSPVASTHVKAEQTPAVALAQVPQHSAALAAGRGGAEIVPSVFTPGSREQEGPGATAPDTTCESGVRGSSLFFR